MSKFSLALDSSAISDFLTCETMWKWKDQMSLVHKYQQTTAMDRGTVMHGLLERYYQTIIDGKDPITAMNRAIAGLKDERKHLSLSKEDYQFLIARFSQYVISRFATNDYIPYRVEKGFSVPVLDTRDFFFVLEGRIDFIGETRHGIKIWRDYKTQSEFKPLHLKSIQFRNYAWATGINHGIISYIGLQENVNPNTFVDQLTYFSNKELIEWLPKLTSIFFRVANAIMSGRYDMNWKSCSDAGYGRKCSYFDLCDSHPSIHEGLIQINYMERPRWSPWSLEEQKDETKSIESR